MSDALVGPSAAADEVARVARAEFRSRELVRAASRLMAREGFESVSMQSLANEAGVSVGLIYRYFESKSALLLAVILQVLDAFDEDVPAAIRNAGDDPVFQVASGFSAYCRVIEEYRHAAVLTYRTSKDLDDAGLALVKRREIESRQPIADALKAGVSLGIFTPCDTDLFAYNTVVLAHAWALKYWYFESRLDMDAYIQYQCALLLRGVLGQGYHKKYEEVLRLS